MGVLLWRGFSIDAAMAQCFGNEEDMGTKGRQMPVVCKTGGELSLSIPDGLFSILALRNITSIPSLPRLLLRSPKPLGSATQ
jgi:hypothetical protein